MAVEGRKLAITGAGRGLGAALAIVAADRGMVPLLLGRDPGKIGEIANIITERTGRRPAGIVCDLASPSSVAATAEAIVTDHRDLDILVNSGSSWSGGPYAAVSDEQVAAVVNSTVSGTLMLTRRLLPLLLARPAADIHTVVSMSGLPYARQVGSSVPSVAAKAAQAGFVQALTEELRGTCVRVTSVYPGLIKDVLPTQPEWDQRADGDGVLTDRDVVDAILYVLDQPKHVAIRSLVIERAQTDFLS